MVKLLLLLFGVAAGGVGTTAWILSESTPDLTGSVPDVARARLEEVKRRFDAARAEGARAQAETENRLRHELSAFQHHPGRPGTSSAR